MSLTLVRQNAEPVELHECSSCSEWARDDEVLDLGWTQDEGEWMCETCADDSGDYWAPWR